MENIVHGISGVSIYLDDIRVMGKSLDDPMTNLEKMFNRLEEAGVRLKQRKFKFMR